MSVMVIDVKRDGNPSVNTSVSDTIIYPAHVSVRKPPVNFDEKDELLFAREWRRTMPAVFLKELRNVDITPRGVMFQKGRILPETFNQVTPVSWRWQVKFWQQRFLPRQNVSSGRPIWFTWPNSLNKFHWLMDSLPRLMSIWSQVDRPLLLLPSAYRHDPYISASLSIFEPNRLEYIPPDRVLSCPELFLPTDAAPSGNCLEPLVQEMGRRYRTRFVTSDQTHFGERIYISRGKSRMRRIANEVELKLVLHRYGFETVYFEDHPFERQVAIAGHARFLVGNHGAGMTNMLFMPPGSRVFELRQEGDCQRNCFFSMASALGLDYYYGLCRPVAEDDDENSDVMVDCAVFEKKLKDMLDSGAVDAGA